MKNSIGDLRNHLFAALEGLADTEHPLDIDRARAIAEVGRVIIETAKAETQFLEVTGGTQGTGFIAQGEPAPPRPRLASGGR